MELFTWKREMATHSNVLAWRIPWTEKPGGLQSMGSHRVGNDWSDLAAAAAGHYWGCPRGSDGKESPCNAGNPGSIPGSGGEMANHSSILAWKIPWTEKPGPQSMGCREKWLSTDTRAIIIWTWSELYFSTVYGKQAYAVNQGFSLPPIKCIIRCMAYKNFHKSYLVK